MIKDAEAESRPFGDDQGCGRGGDKQLSFSFIFTRVHARGPEKKMPYDNAASLSIHKNDKTFFGSASYSNAFNMGML